MKPFIQIIILLTLIFMCSCQQQCNRNKNAEDFEQFYDAFFSDAEFQNSRLQFPLKGSYTDFDTVMKWEKNNWEFLSFQILSADTSEFDIRDDRTDMEILQGMYCKGCGYSLEIKFELINKKWFLTYLQENNF